MMNLVMFGWFSTTPFFQEATDIDMKAMLYHEKTKQIEDDLIPVGIFSEQEEIDNPWVIWKG
jgi:hypothetical protein